jgi:bifunctional enzyme CysN/CysC
MQEKMNIVIVGHVDHGKSTIIGRLLSDTGSLPEGKLQQVKDNCARNSKPFEYAFLLDALKDEQAQGITIDAARVFFKSKKRNYIILDAPGHIEFLRNMITGAARAEAALLVIDAHEGIQENSRRHGYMLSLLGIKQVVVLVNKMDLIDYDQQKFNAIEKEYNEFLKSAGIQPAAFVPVSGMQGVNIVEASEKMAWYSGETVLSSLDAFQKTAPLVDQPFRMQVQDIYKFTALGDSRRIVSGTIESGTLNVGDEVIFYPSGKKSKVKSFEAFNATPGNKAQAGFATGFTLAEQIYITRGELAVKKSETPPKVTTRMVVSIFWLGEHPMVKDKDYFLKIGSARVPMVLEEVQHVIDASSLDEQKKEQIERHDVAQCIIRVKKQVAFDLAADIAATGRFVVVDNYEISGGGIIREALEDKQSWVRDMVIRRNYAWEKSNITCAMRAEKYSQKAALVLICGPETSQNRKYGKAVEDKLFEEGKMVYFLSLESIMFGLDGDVPRGASGHQEHFRRLGELAHILLDAGLIVVVAVDELDGADYDMIKTMVNPDFIEVVYTGKDASELAFPVDLHLESLDEEDRVVGKVKHVLLRRGIIFNPW